jgi:hypothetical protein
MNAMHTIVFYHFMVSNAGILQTSRISQGGDNYQPQEIQKTKKESFMKMLSDYHTASRTG